LVRDQGVAGSNPVAPTKKKAAPDLLVRLSLFSKKKSKIENSKSKMESKPEPIDIRTRKFALRIVKLYTTLPQSGAGAILGKQMLRSGTSVGAQVAEADHSKSAADFINKIQGARQEMQETLYWLQLLSDTEIVKPSLLTPLMDEGRELIAILVAMSLKAKKRL
jgi:four helix bundle protein